MGGSVVTSCSMHVLLSTCGICPGLCARERATKTDNFLPIRTYKIGLIQRNPGNRPIHSRRKKLLRAHHASCSARIELKPRPQVPDGLPVSKYIAFRLKVLVRRDTIQNTRKFHKYTYTYTCYTHQILRPCSVTTLYYLSDASRTGTIIHARPVHSLAAEVDCSYADANYSCGSRHADK